MEVTDSRTKVTITETQFRAALNESLGNRLAAAINWLIHNAENYPVGAVVASHLDAADFALYKPASKWVICDGANVAGSDFDTLYSPTVPDYRGYYLVGANPGTLGAVIPDGFGTHDHAPNPLPARRLIKGDSILSVLTGGTTSNVTPKVFGNPVLFSPSASTANTTSTTSHTIIGVENRPKTRIVNFYIKINL